MNISSHHPSRDLVALDNHYFDLKIPSTTHEKFEIRVLTPHEIYELKPILKNWQKIAKDKEVEYSQYKSKKLYQNNYVNPFANLKAIAREIEVESRNEGYIKDEFYFGAYSKTTNNLQALAFMNTEKRGSKLFYNVPYLVTHPNNIRTRCNKNEEKSSGAASSLIYAIANWKNPLENTELKIEALRLESLKGSRSFYEKIGFKPLRPPHRTHWILPISAESKKEWLENESTQRFIKTFELDYSDKTELTSDES